MGAPPVEEVKRLLPVARDMQRVTDLVVLECFAGHQLIAGVILDEQDLDGLQGQVHAGIPSALSASSALVVASPPGSSGRAASMRGRVKQMRVPSG